VQRREAFAIALVEPVTLALPIELRISSGALLVEGEDELNGLSVAVVGGSVEQGAAGAVDQLVDVSEVLSDQLVSALEAIAELDGFEHPPQHYIPNQCSIFKADTSLHLLNQLLMSKYPRRRFKFGYLFYLP
jgi:hypothetical protein